MAKFKTWFSQLKEQGKINKPEFDAFIESLKDDEIPDEIIAEIENKFLTRDRALSDQDIMRKARAEVLDGVDPKVNELIEYQMKDYLDPLQVQEMAKSNTYKKLDLLKQYIPSIIKKLKNNGTLDEDGKKQIKEFQKTIEELGQEKRAMTEQFTKEKETIDEQWSRRLEQTELSYHLDKLSNKYTLAEAFEQDRDAVNQLVMGKVKAHNLKLIDNNGQKSIVVNDEHGKPKYNGNSEVTIQNLLEEGYKPYLKKSEGTPPRSQATPRTQTITPQNQTTGSRQGTRTTVTK